VFLSFSSHVLLHLRSATVAVGKSSGDTVTRKLALPGYMTLDAVENALKKMEKNKEIQGTSKLNE
jgi:hypothetical protein